jgi:hypothetical protein
MTAPIPIQRGREIRARNIALAKAERVRELAEDFAAVRGVNGAQDDEARAMVAAYYVDQGFASETDVRLALEALEEP